MGDAPRSSSRPSLQVVAGRYQLLRKIGNGGMGAVYLAKQIGVGNQVALKFLPAHLSDDPQLRKRFEREAALNLEVNHPGAAQLLDAGTDADGQLYLAFEYVEGDDLSTLLDREGALSFDDAITLTCKVAEVLAFAHAKGVVHRDIKPENIRVRRDLAGLHVKVLDFGIARLVDGVGTQLTADGSVAGTPRYMAPEQISADPIDARTDIYALGLVLFEALSGREAFTRDSTSQLLWAQLNDPVPSLIEVQPLRDYPALDAVIAQACAKAPEQRFANMQALVEALRALQSPQWWGVPVAVPRRSRPVFDSAEVSAREPVQLPRPGRKTFLQIRASAWAAIAVGTLAVGLASTALWVALDQRSVRAPVAAVPATPPSAPEPASVAVAVAPAAPASAQSASSAPQPVVAVAPAATAVAQPVAPKPAVKVAPLAAPSQPSEPDTTAAKAPAAPATTTAVATGEMPECPQLNVYDDPMTKMTVAQLEQKARNVKYMAPSAIATQIETIKNSAYSFHPNARECLYRAMLIRFVLNENVVLASSASLWGHTRTVPELERLFMEQPLKQDWTPAQRKDVLRQIETLFIANLQKDAPGDDAYWRRMYYGLIFMCEATGEAREKAGAKRVTENNCPKLQPSV
jgi:eukaryotic-like serine/threonine-protein kinase